MHRKTNEFSSLYHKKRHLQSIYDSLINNLAECDIKGIVLRLCRSQNNSLHYQFNKVAVLYLSPNRATCSAALSQEQYHCNNSSSIGTCAGICLMDNSHGVCSTAASLK